jgi:hypothetical protein
MTNKRATATARASTSKGKGDSEGKGDSKGKSEGENAGFFALVSFGQNDKYVRKQWHE